MLTYSPSTSFLRLKSYTDPANLHPVQGYNSDRFVVWKIQLEIARDPDFFLGESKEKEEEEVVQFSSKKKVIRDAGSGNAARENELDSHLTMNNVCQRNCGEF